MERAMRELRCFPHDDPAFAAAVSQAFAVVERIPGLDGDEERFLRLVKVALGPEYPDARFVRQEPLVAWPDGTETWSAYRDGRPVNEHNSSTLLSQARTHI
jgi:hypothetical protein